MFWIIGILTVILLVAVVVAMYLAASYVETPSNVRRVITTFGKATHVMKSGPGFVLVGIQQYYDYDQRKFVIDLEAEDIFTGKVQGEHDDKVQDEMPLKIDSTLIFDMSKADDKGMLDVFNYGLAPDAGGFLSDSDVEGKRRVIAFIEKFVHAIQSDLVGGNSYRTVIFHKNEFAKVIQVALRSYESEGSINPFKTLHVDKNLTYVINRVIPPPKFVEAMPMKAIADQEGEGIIAEATHKRKADKLALTLIKDYPDPAKIEVMQEFAKGGKSTIFIPTNIADGLGQIAKSIAKSIGG